MMIPWRDLHLVHMRAAWEPLDAETDSRDRPLAHREPLYIPIASILALKCDRWSTDNRTSSARKGTPLLCTISSSASFSISSFIILLSSSLATHRPRLTSPRPPPSIALGLLPQAFPETEIDLSFLHTAKIASSCISFVKCRQDRSPIWSTTIYIYSFNYY